MIIIMILAMRANTEKLGVLGHYLKNLVKIITNQIRTDGSFTGRNNNYIEYTSKGERYENLLPKEYRNMIRRHLRNLINDHKPIDESNHDDDNTDCAEWKIQLTMENNFISTKSIEETRTIYIKS